MKLILSEGQYVRMLLKEGKLTPAMKFFIDYSEQTIPILNSMYMKLTFLTVNDILGREGFLNKLESKISKIDSEAHNFLRRATDIFGANSPISDDEYDNEWYDIHTDLDDRYHAISDKAMAIQEIIMTLQNLSDLQDIKNKFKDIKTITTQ